MRTFKWTVPSTRHSDPNKMDRAEYDHWCRVRARGVEWFVVQKGLLLLVAVPSVSALTGGPTFEPEMAAISWFGGLCAGILVWAHREQRFARARDDGMRAPGDDALE